VRHLRMAVWAFIATHLAAQAGDSGFKWVGLRAGSLSFDSLDNAKAGTFFGGQAGMVFDQKQYGVSLEAITAHPKSNLYPGRTFGHNEFSATLLRGLSGDSQSPLWPYFGVGLGSLTAAQDDPGNHTVVTNNAVMAVGAFGLLHRPAPNLVWGVEGRWLVTITAVKSRERQDYQGSLLVGFSWGTPEKSSRPAPSLPPPPARPTPPPAVKEAPAPPTPAPIPAAPARGVAVPTPPAPRTGVPPAQAPPPRAANPTPAPAPAPRMAAPVPAPAVPAAPPPPMPPVVQAKPPAAPVSPAAAAPGNPLGGDPALAQRLDALRTGDMVRALELGRKRVEAMPRNHWTLRLEIADLPSTLRAAVAAFPGRNPDLFIVPILLKGGKISYQLFLGAYASKAEAERAAKTVPAAFLEGGERPRPYLVSAIPAQGSR
jgi:hypothetical protein